MIYVLKDRPLEQARRGVRVAAPLPQVPFIPEKIQEGAFRPQISAPIIGLKLF